MPFWVSRPGVNFRLLLPNLLGQLKPFNARLVATTEAIIANHQQKPFRTILTKFIATSHKQKPLKPVSTVSQLLAHEFIIDNHERFIVGTLKIVGAHHEHLKASQNSLHNDVAVLVR